MRPFVLNFFKAIISTAMLLAAGCDQSPPSSPSVPTSVSPKLDRKIAAEAQAPLLDVDLASPPATTDDAVVPIIPVVPIDGGGSQGALQDARTGNPDQNVREPRPDGECGNGEQEVLPSERNDCPHLLYGSTIIDEAGASNLVYFNKSTGQGTNIGPITNLKNVSAIDFGPDGQLWAVGDDLADKNVLAKINCLTGAPTSVINTNLTDIVGMRRGSITDINFNAQGQLWAHFKSNTGPTQILTLNINGIYTKLPSPTGLNSTAGNGLAFAPFPGLQTLFHASATTLSSINQATGLASTITSLNFPAELSGNPRINAMDLDPFPDNNQIMYVSINDNIAGSYLGELNLGTGAVSKKSVEAPAGLDGLAVNRRYEECDISSTECIDCELHEKNCEDSVDNDFDGLTDCADEDCLNQSCNDGSVCTENDTCKSVGAEGCDGDNPCEDYNECTDDSCSPSFCPQADEGPGCVPEPFCAHSLDEDKTNWGDCTADPTGDPNYDENIPDSAICFVGRCEQPPNESPQCVTKNLNEIAISETVHGQADGCLDDDPCTADSCIPIRVPDEENSGESITRPFCEYQTILGVQCDHDENSCTIETCQKSNVEDNGGVDDASIQVSANGAASLGISCEPSQLLNGPQGDSCTIEEVDGGPYGICAIGQNICREGVQTTSCAQVIFRGQVAEICGNDKDEDCDGVINNGCPKLVFVTMALFESGGGIQPAHDLCNQEATDAGKPGNFKAWISGGGFSPDASFIKSSGPYALADGTKVADDYNDLASSDIDNPINRHADGTLASGANGVDVWTGTQPDGQSTDRCTDWTLLSGLRGVTGLFNTAGSQWTNSKDSTCDLKLPVYCFEQ